MSHDETQEVIRLYSAALIKSAVARALEGKLDTNRPSEASNDVLLEVWRKGVEIFFERTSPDDAKQFAALATDQEREDFFHPDSVFSFGTFLKEHVRAALKREGHTLQ